jgi:hypothetical protein
MADGLSLAQQIDWLIQQRKTLLGVRGDQDWVRGNMAGEERISWPVAISGQSVPGLTLSVVAYPHGRPRTWHINLLAPARISGLDHNPEGGHTNSALRPSDNDLSYLVPGSHVHLWADNRHFCTHKALPERLLNARPLPKPLGSFYDSLRWFCDCVNIEFPSGVVIDLPPRDRLAL